MDRLIPCPGCSMPVSPTNDPTCPKCSSPVLGHVFRGLLEVDVAHSGESWETARSKITAAINQGILHGHKGVKIIHGYGASSGRARIRHEAILLLRSLASATSGRLSQDRHNPGAHILWLNR